VNARAKQDYLSGLHYLRKNSTVDQAFPPLERALAADPDSPLTHAAMAEAYWWKYRISSDKSWVPRSEAALRSAEQRNPDLPEVLTIAGQLLANVGRLEHAQAAYLRAIEIDPLRDDPHRRLGMAYMASNESGKALAALRRAMTGTRRLPESTGPGAFHIRKAQYRTALPHFEEMVELAPLEPTAYFALATLTPTWAGL
jgi:Tfp pilus assembly protein PilF